MIRSEDRQALMQFLVWIAQYVKTSQNQTACNMKLVTSFIAFTALLCFKVESNLIHLKISHYSLQKNQKYT